MTYPLPCLTRYRHLHPPPSHILIWNPSYNFQAEGDTTFKWMSSICGILRGSPMSGVARERQPRLKALPVANDSALPTDVLCEVLIRLPAKELCRLRIVCRAWRELTSDSCFAEAHSTRHPLIIGLRKQGGEIHIMDLSGHVVKRTHIEQGSCCDDLRTHPNIVFIRKLERNMDACVLNLATGAVTVLPTIFGHITFGHTYMLGYVPSIGECKVLRHNKYFKEEGGTGDMYHIVTLDGGDGQWRVRACPPMDISWIFDHRVVIDGVAYFLSDDHNNNNTCTTTIIMFDLRTEEWRQSTLQVPFVSSIIFIGANKNLPMHVDIQLTELNGCLVAVDCKRHDYSIDLWFLEDMDQGLWTKRHTIPGSLGMDDCWLCPLIVLADGRIVLRHFRGGVLRAYDQTTSTWADLASLTEYSGIAMLSRSLLCSGL
ncbi:hypothetical protein EJB05_01953, partial [Eragrostis curvula]